VARGATRHGRGGEIARGDTGGRLRHGDCRRWAGDGSERVGAVERADTRPANTAQPDLFYNFYTQRRGLIRHAQMYTPPVPVPPHFGQRSNGTPFQTRTRCFNKHTDKFHNYYDGGRGMNRASSILRIPPVKTAVSNFLLERDAIPANRERKNVPID